MPSILVVDVDADTRRNMAEIFADLGYAVDAAESGEVALDLAGRQAFDLGLLDLRMPGMDGLTLCQHLTRLYPRMVAMIITAYGAGHLLEEARIAGARHILPKPIDFTRLLALVAHVIPQAS
jgi:CheY-like chemotaxis protein